MDDNDLTFDFGLDLDFDIADFVTDLDTEPQKNIRIFRPRLDLKDIRHKVMFDNAKQFAKQIDLTPGARTFAWISGNFIFGDIIEALIAERLVMPEEIYIASLSISQENIDSLRNVQIMAGPYLKRLNLVLSGYQYSHEKYRLVPYMYQELDNTDNSFQVAFGGYHSKVITLKTINGHTITVHGSANLRSSNSIEQIAVEIDNEELHDFNAGIITDICERFGTINHNAPYNRLKRIEGKEAWEIIRDAGEHIGE